MKSSKPIVIRSGTMVTFECDASAGEQAELKLISVEPFSGDVVINDSRGKAKPRSNGQAAKTSRTKKARKR